MISKGISLVQSGASAKRTKKGHIIFFLRHVQDSRECFPRNGSGTWLVNSLNGCLHERDMLPGLMPHRLSATGNSLEEKMD